MVLLSTAPDITEGLPALTTARELSQQIADRGAQWDVNVGGVGFVLRAVDDTPYRRQSVASVKDQFDTSKEAGEQTLSGYWIRSQTSWHMGAGVNFYEPGTDELSQYRFDSSVGVDVWSEGEAKLLRSTTRVNAAPPAGAAQFVTAAYGFLFVTDQGKVDRYKQDSDGVFSFDVTVSKKTNAPTSGVVACGGSIVVGTDTGLEVCVNPTAVTPSFTAEWTSTSSGGWWPYWVKDRIVAAHGNELRELTLAGGDLSTVTAFYAHADTGWVWADVCEAGQAILGAGRSGDDTGVYSFSLVDPGGGGSPVLGAPVKVAVLPPGEVIYSMAVYLGSYVGLGTSKGIRVGLVNASGDLQYGPLTVETTSPVRALTGGDRFLYAAVENQIAGATGAVRVDVSLPVGDGLRFPWAWDAQTHTTGTPRSITLLNEADPRVVVAVDGAGVYAQNRAGYETSGWLLSGKVRFGTVEPKSFEKADVRADVSGGKVVFAVVDDHDQENTLYTVGDGGGAGRNINLTWPQGVHEYLQVKLTLTGDGAGTPVLNSCQLKALPKPPAQWRVSYPLMCVDSQKTRNGLTVGREGFAWARLQALEALQADRVTVLVQDFRVGEAFNGAIEQVDFVEPTPRGRSDRDSFGGTLTVTVRRYEQ